MEVLQQLYHGCEQEIKELQEEKERLKEIGSVVAQHNPPLTKKYIFYGCAVKYLKTALLDDDHE